MITFLIKNIKVNMFYGFEHAKNGIKLLHNASISNKNKQWIKN